VEIAIVLHRLAVSRRQVVRPRDQRGLDEDVALVVRRSHCTAGRAPMSRRVAQSRLWPRVVD
jgi:hypothetical protein